MVLLFQAFKVVKDYRESQDYFGYFYYKSGIPGSRQREALDVLAGYGDKVRFEYKDGKLTSGTNTQFYNAVADFQKQHSMRLVDGYVGRIETGPALLKEAKGEGKTKKLPEIRQVVKDYRESQDYFGYFYYKSGIKEEMRDAVLEVLREYGDNAAFEYKDGKLISGTNRQFYNAVADFQKQHGLKLVDGLVGANTGPALQNQLE